jgi:hypothetical protein
MPPEGEAFLVRPAPPPGDRLGTEDEVDLAGEDWMTFEAELAVAAAEAVRRFPGDPVGSRAIGRFWTPE